MRLCEFKKKEVINSCDCTRLGFTADLQIDEGTGAIQAIVVPESGKLCPFFGTDKEYVIPWENIRKIGPDIIIVDICAEKFLQKL